MSTIKTATLTGTWTVRAGGAVIGESRAAVELTEEGYEPVIYFPRVDIATALLDPSDHTTLCEARGTARFYSIITKSGTIENAAWSYEEPKAEALQIKGHFAFHTGDLVTVERL
ncbi:MAG: DUF427 domain-containing protein [Rhodobacterales bacterium]|nr:DUF427 domain-containing protein [Rhodobacterales bacterium]